MKTANDMQAAALPNAISIHPATPEEWLRRPSHAIGAGPFVPKPWPAWGRMPALTTIGPLYASHLASRDPAKVWMRLHGLVEGPPVLVNGAGPIDRYIRRLLATWFERELGEVVPELDGSAPTPADLGFDPWA